MISATMPIIKLIFLKVLKQKLIPASFQKMESFHTEATSLFPQRSRATFMNGFMAGGMWMVTAIRITILFHPYNGSFIEHSHKNIIHRISVTA